MSDLSEMFGGCDHYSRQQLDEIKRKVLGLSDIEKLSVGKELLEKYKAEVKEDRREQFPMEDWIKVMYNRCS